MTTLMAGTGTVCLEGAGGKTAVYRRAGSDGWTVSTLNTRPYKEGWFWPEGGSRGTWRVVKSVVSLGHIKILGRGWQQPICAKRRR